MANQNTIADLSTTPASNLNVLGQSQQGTAPASTIDNIFQRYGAILATFYDSLGGSATAAGTATALTVTVTEDWTAYANGLFLAIKAPSAATGAATLVVTVPTAGALASKKIRRQGDSAIQANDWLADSTILLKYDSAYDSAAGAWVLLNAVPAAAVTPGMTDEQRRNALLTLASIAKLDAGYKHQLNTFADGYKASDGVNSGSSTNYSVTTASGFVGPTVSVGSQISGATGTNIGTLTSNGGLAAAFDGTTSQAIASSAFTAMLTGVHGYIGKNYSASPKKIFQATFYTSTDFGISGNGAVSVTVTLRGMHTAPSSANDAGSTSLGSVTFTDSNSQQTKTITSTDNTTAWEYVWIDIAPGGSNPDAIIAELQLFPSSFNNMTLVTTTQTADASVSNGRVLMEIDPIDAITANTDLTVEVTCDVGGSTHWAPATLSSIGKGQSGRTVVETADTACTAGTSFAARIKTLNNKSVNVYKATMVVH